MEEDKKTSCLLEKLNSSYAVGDTSEIFLSVGQQTKFSPRRLCRLSYTEGEVYPYKGFELPEVLQVAIMMYDHGDHRGNVPAIKSGKRSALVPADSKWFKIKGCSPSTQTYPRAYDKPLGSMSEQTAKNELLANEIVARKLNEYGFDPPHISTALVRYPIRFKRGNNYAVILQTNGETRLDFDHETFGLDLRRTRNAERDTLDRFLTSTSSWLGFSIGLMKEAGISIEHRSVDLTNVSIFRTRDGFGIFPVDHERTFTDIAPYELVLKRLLDCLKKLAKSMHLEGADYERNFFRALEGHEEPQPISQDILNSLLYK